MKFTLKWLKEKQASHYLIDAFVKKFGNSTSLEKLVKWLHNISEDFWESWILGQDDALLTEMLLEAGANPNVNENDALKRAASKGYLNTVKVLCFWGADVRAENDFSFKVAAGKGYLKTAQFLKNFEPEVNIHAGDEYALKEAVRNNYFHMVDYLLSLGAWHDNIIQIAENWGRDRMKKKLLTHIS